MNLYSVIVKLITFVCLSLVLANPGYAAFDKRWYLGLGAGMSFIEPDPVDSGYKVADDTASGVKLFLGWDFAERWGVELYVADLGEASLDEKPGEVLTPPSGSVSYEAAGISALFHIYNTDGDDGRYDRRGLSLFGKLGGGFLDTSSDELVINQLEDYHLMAGLGLEYAFESGLALRAEYEAYDTDAQFASVSLLWRFGQSNQPGASGAIFSATAGPADSQAESATAPQHSPGAVVLIDEQQPADADSDGVADLLDSCPGTPAQVLVNARGCPMFDKRLEGVNFVSGSATLTEQAKVALDELATDLINTPEVRIAIMAHTDNEGSAASNLELSKQRAISVARYLVSQGVAAARLRPEAYGESQPMVSNATAEGRRQNRRVEFRALR